MAKLFDYFMDVSSNGMDIGANIGYTTLQMSQIANGGIIFAIEPEFDNFEILKHNLAINKISNVQCFQCALSNKFGRFPIYKNLRNFGDHRIWREKKTKRKIIKGSKVNVTTLDQLMEDIKMKFDCVKVDIQGSEPLFFLGAEKFLKDNSHCVFIIEYWPHGISRTYSINKFCDFLFSHFKEIIMIENNRKLSWKELIKWSYKRPGECNLLCKGVDCEK